MPAGVIFLLICCVTVPGALLMAYLHARVLGWDPRETPGVLPAVDLPTDWTPPNMSTSPKDNH